MDTQDRQGQQLCAAPGCGRRLSGIHSLFARNRIYKVNGSLACSAACFRAQLRFILSRWIKMEETTEPAPKKSKIGLILLDSKVINSVQLDRVLEIQQAGDHRRIGELVQKLGFATERQITIALSRQEGLPWLDAELNRAESGAEPFVPPELAASSLIQPMNYDAIINELYVLSAAPVDRLALEALEQMNRCHVNVFIGPESRVRDAISQYCKVSRVIRPQKPEVFQGTEYLDHLIDGTLHFYHASSAAYLTIARCRQLIWMRADGPKGRSDWFVLLDPRATRADLRDAVSQ